MAPKLPMSIIMASGGAGSFTLLSFPLFLALKHDPSEMRVVDGTCQYVAADHSSEATINRTSLGALGEGTMRRCKGGGTCGKDVATSFRPSSERQ